MASSATPLAERAEVHKSCKTLESVVNILNDYCEAANAIVQLQKKLAKALREAASPKCVSEIPGMSEPMVGWYQALIVRSECS